MLSSIEIMTTENGWMRYTVNRALELGWTGSKYDELEHQYADAMWFLNTRDLYNYLCTVTDLLCRLEGKDTDSGIKFYHNYKSGRIFYSIHSEKANYPIFHVVWENLGELQDGQDSYDSFTGDSREIAEFFSK